jgi:hypothetical protein
VVDRTTAYTIVESIYNSIFKAAVEPLRHYPEKVLEIQAAIANPLETVDYFKAKYVNKMQMMADQQPQHFASLAGVASGSLNLKQLLAYPEKANEYFKREVRAFETTHADVNMEGAKRQIHLVVKQAIKRIFELSQQRIEKYKADPQQYVNEMEKALKEHNKL